jgi:hypothetical protein
LQNRGIFPDEIDAEMMVRLSNAPSAIAKINVKILGHLGYASVCRGSHFSPDVMSYICTNVAFLPMLDR